MPSTLCSSEDQSAYEDDEFLLVIKIEEVVLQFNSALNIKFLLIDQREAPQLGCKRW